MSPLTFIIGNVGLTVAAISSSVFVVAYGFAAPWTKSVFGRFYFFQSLIIALILDFFILRLIFGRNDFLDLVRLVLFIGVPIYLVWQLWLFYRIQAQKEVNGGSGNSEGIRMGDDPSQHSSD